MTVTAALDALRRAGIDTAAVAAAAGVREARVRAELDGRRPLSVATLDALRGLGSPHVAEEVASLAGRAKVARLEERPTGRM